MKNYIKIAAVSPSLKVADISYNAQRIIEACSELSKIHCQIILFPELSLTGYSCGDLFFQRQLLDTIPRALLNICQSTKNLSSCIIVGSPIERSSKLYNCAVIISNGKIKGIIPKTYLPNRNEFYEERWFSREISNKGIFGTDLIFQTDNFKFSVEICEDLWSPIPPSTYQALSGSHIIFNPSASNALIAKSDYRRKLVKQQSARLNCGYVYASAGPGESTTDIVYSGHLMICENGTMLAESTEMTLKNSTIITEIDIDKIEGERLRSSSFSQTKIDKVFRYINIDIPETIKYSLTRIYDKHPFVPSDEKTRDSRCKEIIGIQSMGLAKRLSHTGLQSVIIGVSGGLDSTLALLVCMETFKKLGLDPKGIKSITMPGLGTSKTTEDNATKLIGSLGTDFYRIPINNAVLSHLKDIKHIDENGDIPKDITFENAQARERTQILFDMANKYKGIVIGTGNMSEMALGWCTYSGDHLSSYNVNCSIPKTLVKYLVKWYSDQMSGPSKDILLKILETPISPELLPLDSDGNIIQKTEEKIGPYELHDFFLYHMIRNGFSYHKIWFICTKTFPEYPSSIIEKWLMVFIDRFFKNQFKRSAMPDGPKVGSVSLSPRGDWRMPSDSYNLIDSLR